MTAGVASFSRHCRLTGAHAYAEVFAFKYRVGGDTFLVYACPNGSARPRLGVVVNKRDIAHATARNYCKRLAREVFRAEQPLLGGTDAVVRARVEITRANGARARAELRDLLRQAGRECQRRAAARQ